MTLRREEGKDIGDQEKKGSVDLMSTSGQRRKRFKSKMEKRRHVEGLEFIPEILVRMSLRLVAILGLAPRGSRDEVEEPVFA